MLFTRSCLLSLVSVAALVVAADPFLSPYRLHEKRASTPVGWSRTRKHDAAAILPLRLGLAQSNMDKLEQLLLDVSDPDSPNFGSHWSAGKVADTFAPSHESVKTVHKWLTASGIEPSRIKLSSAKTWIEINATVEEAERLLVAEYHVYQHDTGKEHIACDSYHLPEHVSKHVDIVMPTVHFDTIVKRSGSLANIGQPGVGLTPKTTGAISELLTDLADCDQQITPICLKALYGLVYEPLATSKNSLGIVEYTPQAYLQADLDIFFTNFSTNLVGKSPVLVSIDGGYAQTEYQYDGYNAESDLDLQYAMAIADPLPVTLYQTGDLYQGASFNTFLDAIDGSYCTFEGGDLENFDPTYPDTEPGGYNHTENCGTTKPANVISTSYSYTENELGVSYAARQCAEYAKLGLMGVTVLYSSGDYGVAGNYGECLYIEGSDEYVGFSPTFPSGCPYVTSVGATQINPGSSVLDPETACWDLFYSGGGFSNYFATPSYQQYAVSSYLKNFPPPYPAGQFNATGRGFPDVAANGVRYVVAVDGEYELVYGTSASSPATAAILSLVNDARLAAGKGPIGFINPSIYSPAFFGAFNDIKNGSNPGCDTAGFNATEGWDPVTGLGTPNFPQLLARWLLLP